MSAAHSAAGEIVQVFDAFRDAGLWPHPSYGHRTQRAAAETLLKAHGLDRVLQFVAFAKHAAGKPYAPTITTPLQLKDKLGALAAYGERLKGDRPRVAIID